MIPKRIEIGEVLHGYPASTHNWLIDAVQRLLAVADGEGQAGGTAPLRPGEPHVLIDVANTTGAELPQHGVVSLEKPHFDPSDDTSAQQEDLLFTGVDADPDLPFGVLRIPIAASAVGERSVVVSGPALVRLNLTDTSHTMADVVAADNDKLHSGTTGRATIWWYEKQGDGGTETGEQWAVVMLGGGGGGTSITHHATAYAVVTTAASAASHSSTGIVPGLTGECKLLDADGGILQEGGADADPVPVKSRHEVPLQVDKIILLDSDKPITPGQLGFTWGRYVDPADYWLAHPDAGNDKLLGQSGGEMTFQTFADWSETAAGFGSGKYFGTILTAAPSWELPNSC